MRTVRQAPRMLTLSIKWQIRHTTALQLHNTPLRAGTLARHAVTLSSIHSFGPHHVLIIVPCYCNGIMLFTVKIVNHTTLLVLSDKWIGFWEEIKPAAAIIRTYTKQEWKLSAYMILHENCYSCQYKLLLCIKTLYLFLYPLIYPLFSPFSSKNLCSSEVLTVKRDAKLMKANPVSDVYILPYSTFCSCCAQSCTLTRPTTSALCPAPASLFALREWHVDGLLCDIITVMKY